MSKHQFILVFCLWLSSSSLLFGHISPEIPIHTSILKNNSTTFNLHQQGNIQGTIHQLRLISSAGFGKTVLNKDNSITYFPEENTCAETDQFSYQITDDKGTYILTFLVEIRCEALTILNGFSTDEAKDPHTFTIVGVEDFPNNSLSIFNSDGNEIFSQKGYQNNWNGSVNEQLLPNDYTYYYVFDDGTGNTYSGYLRLN